MTNEELCLLIQHGSDKKSYMEQLYLQNKGLINQIAKKYSGYCELEDLLQEGYFGLLDAAKSYDDTKGAAFSTYAYDHIRAVIHRYIEDNSSTIRVPSAQRSLILKMNRFIDGYIKKYSHKPSVEDLAKALNISEKKVLQLVGDSLMLETKSINESIFKDDERCSLEDCIEDNNNLIENCEIDIYNSQLKKVLWEIVDGLEPMQSKIIHERYENNKTLNNLSQDLNLTPAQVRTYESGAMRELRKSKNTRKLQSFTEDIIYSISARSVGFQHFNHTWTSSTEKAVLVAEGLS